MANKELGPDALVIQQSGDQESFHGVVAAEQPRSIIVERDARELSNQRRPGVLYLLRLSATASRVGRRSRINGSMLFFFVVVVLPTLGAAIYYFAIASDQYATEFHLGVRSADPQKDSASTLFESGMAAASQIGLDSNVVVQYMQSRAMVDALQSRLNIRAMYATPNADFLSRFNPKAPIEDFVAYWQQKIDPFFDLTTGAISVQVKAFTAQDAERISAEVIKLSESLVNRMAQRAHDDEVGLNKAELADAEVRLDRALQAMRAFRDKNSIVDTSKEEDARLSLVAKLRDEISTSRIELARSRSYLTDDAPSIKELLHEIQAEQIQLKAAEAQLTATDSTARGTPLSSDIGGYQTLSAEIEFAQKYYDSTLQSLLQAEEQANRQATYLEVFVPPAIAQTATYPRRAQDTVIVFLVASGLWLLTLLIYRSVREHAT
jgi:capsular polysaccharide transport system permease protein